MKHPLSTTMLLLGLFVVAQLVGLTLINLSISKVAVVDGVTVLEHTETAIGERPNLYGYQSFLYLFIGVAIGTGLILLLIKFQQVNLWKLWFLLAVWLSTSIAIGVLIPKLWALVLGLLLGFLKVYKPHPITHNITEILMYSGIAVLLVPIFSLFWMLLLLFAMSVYDAIAVWQSKHMVKMAEFQMRTVFAGLLVPKKGATLKLAARKSTVQKRVGVKAVKGEGLKQGASNAILGGGDVAFPLLFAGVVMEGLIRGGASKTMAFSHTLVITLGATTALAYLFFIAKKDKFYPAMPFLTVGCLLGWAVTLLL